MNLSPLTSADIPEVMRIERLPGYELLVGRFDADEHAAQMASAEVRYLGFRNVDGLTGFVILQEFDAPTVLLRRIAVSRVEQGIGSQLVRGVMDWVFETTPAVGLRLEVALGNTRAKHVYEREGFQRYGADHLHEWLQVPRERWARMRGR